VAFGHEEESGDGLQDPARRRGHVGETRAERGGGGARGWRSTGVAERGSGARGTEGRRGIRGESS